MNKTPSLLEAFDVKNEEMSLDNMLRDLGFGDGTEAARKEGLIQAARQYESDLKNGLFRNAMRGRLIRLLLVQIQQLKAGLLSALASIDILVAANRLNIQLLTAIPAVLLVTFGTRLFLRSLYSLRMKDIRPIQDVHAEMAELLDRMETRLLLGALTPVELGEFVLTMHSYLVLLDYCSPPFPGRSCDAIRKSMQDMLQQSRDLQGGVLHLIKQKHMDLLKYL
jgi:nuclear-control-of-ATPase protein 2